MLPRDGKVLKLCHHFKTNRSITLLYRKRLCKYQSKTYKLYNTFQHSIISYYYFHIISYHVVKNVNANPALAYMYIKIEIDLYINCNVILSLHYKSIDNIHTLRLLCAWLFITFWLPSELKK